MLVNCDTCHKQFDAKELKTRLLDKGVVEHFFDCPHCLTIYPVMKTDGQIRAMQKKQTALEEKVKYAGRPMNVKELAEWTFRQRRIKEMLDRLNGKVKANAE